MSIALSNNQQLFAAELHKDTGLNLDVIDAWLRNEEPAISSNGANGANNFLNIGITDSASYGEQNSVWATPISAADATAAWMHGHPIGAGGYGPTDYPGGATTGGKILASVGQGPAQQIAAIQSSGWASGGESALTSLYNEIAGGGVATLPGANPNLTAAASTAGSTPSNQASSGSGGSSSGSGGSFLPGGYITTSGGILSAFNPFNAIAGVWDALLSDAKYAGLFIGVLAVGALLIVKGFSANGVKTPRINVIPVPA